MANDNDKKNKKARNTASVKNLNTVNYPTYVPVRILWPALGFPAVIDPESDDPGTNRIHVLFLTTVRKFYSAAKVVAKHLRYTTWDNRHTHRMDPPPACSFEAKDIKVRGIRHTAKDRDKHVQQLCFAGDSILAGLSNFVRRFYAKANPRLKYLYQATISQKASKQLKVGETYHIFWNSKKDTKLSDEMQFLIDNFANRRARGNKHITKKFSSPHKLEEFREFLVNEYKYEFGAIHPPYNKNRPIPHSPYTEVLHPIFVQESKKKVKIAHLTDLHFHVRADVYEHNLKGFRNVKFNNWNRSSEKLYLCGGNRCDLLLLTGDLVDYGRGHLGLSPHTRTGLGPAASLDDNGAYHRDRNWMLFYYLMVSGDAYKKPAYTILGNHDWRINPYPPFAIAGAPSPKSVVHNAKNFTDKELEKILEEAHGPGHETLISYDKEAVRELGIVKKSPGDTARSLFGLFRKKHGIDLPGIPTETNVDSVAWYLLLINPFLDYAFSYPGGYKIAMYDWGEDEYVLFRTVSGGVEYLLAPTTSGGPRASNCLSKLQQRMTKWFLGRKSDAKIVGIHSPIIAPWPHYTEDLLKTGRFSQDAPKKPQDKGRGTRRTDTYVEDPRTGRKVLKRVSYGHPIRPFAEKYDPDGQLADYGAIAHGKSRRWVIEEFREYKDRGDSGMQPPPAIVFSGHNHRSNLLVVMEPTFDRTDMMVRSIEPKDASNVRYFKPDGTREMDLCPPLYLNTTSAGPRGHAYPSGGVKKKSEYVDPAYAEVELSSDGTIGSVVFKTG